MRKSLLVFLFVGIAFYLGCEKSGFPPTSKTPSLADQALVNAAMSQFSKDYGNFTADPLSPNPRMKIEKTPNWSLATVLRLRNNSVVIVPIKYQKDFPIYTGLDQGRLFQINDMAKLVIYTDSLKNIHEEVITSFPDSNYERSGNTSFSGILKIETWNGQFLHEYKYSKDKIETLTSGSSQGSVQKRSGTVIPDAVIPADQEVSVCYTAEFYNYSVEDPDNGDYFSEDLGCTTYSVDESGSAGGGYYGGLASAGGSTVGTVNNNILANRGNNTIVNVKDYIKCFNNAPGTSYSISLMVDEPVPGSSASYSSTTNSGGSGFNVGHAFLTFSQTQYGTKTRRSIGLYPSGPVSPFNPSSLGSLNDDEGHQYDVSLTFTVSGSAFMNILNFCANGNTVNYNLNSNNCATWSLASLAAGGISLNPPTGTWPFGGGEDPGDLGEYIRNMPLPSGWSKNVAGGNTPVNVGNCVNLQ